MAITTPWRPVATTAPSGDDIVAPRSRRQVRRRRALPGGRAVVGGFLVAASAVGSFAAYEASSRVPTSSYVVLADDVEAGEPLDPADLDLVVVDLPDRLRRHAFDDARPLVGATALAPLTRGQLLQAGDVAKPTGAPELAQISLPVDPAFALDGDIRRGERVDVIVTYAESGESVTSTIVSGALVVGTSAGDRVVGRSGALVVVLAVPPEQLEEVARAGAAGKVALARTTGVHRPTTSATEAPSKPARAPERDG